MTRRLLIVLSVLAVVLSMAVPASADTSFSNVATATATQSHPRAVDQAWQVAPAVGSVGADNEATAESGNCTGCHAVALAFQVLIVSDAGPNLTLTNNATAINSVCVQCVTEAVADQWMVADTGAQIRLTPAGQFALFLLHLQVTVLLLTQPLRLTELDSYIDNRVDAILSQDVVVVPSLAPAVGFAAAAAAPTGGITITHHEQVSP